MSNGVKQTGKIITEELKCFFSNIKEEQVSNLIRVIEEKREKKIYLIGQGRSGLMARAFAMRLMHLGFNVFVASETITPAIEKEDLVIACSGSGETGITCYLADKAREIGVRIVTIVAQKDSRLSRMADIVVMIPVAPKFAKTEEKRSIQHPGSLFEQALLLLLDTIVVLLKKRCEETSAGMDVRHTNLE